MITVPLGKMYGAGLDDPQPTHPVVFVCSLPALFHGPLRVGLKWMNVPCSSGHCSM